MQVLSLDRSQSRNEGSGKTNMKMNCCGTAVNGAHSHWGYQRHLMNMSSPKIKGETFTPWRSSSVEPWGGLILHTSDLCLCVLFQVVWECEAAGGRAHTQGEMLISSQWGRLVWLEPEGMREGFWLARGGACCRN